MMLIDSNIIIYATQPEYYDLRNFIEINAPFISAVSYVEVLGYHKLTEPEKDFLEIFFNSARIMPISQKVLDAAVKLRQQRKITLGDAFIAGTALAYDLELVTRNIQDFQWIEGLSLHNPIDR